MTRGCLPVVVVVALLLVAAVLVLASQSEDSADRGSGATTPPSSAPLTTGPAPTSPVPGSDAVASNCPEQSGLIQRDCGVFSPPGVGTGERLPTVVLLPGLGDSPMGVRSSGNWLDAVVDRRLVLVTPGGLFASWNAGACCGLANGTGIDDVSYLATLIDRIKQRPDVDPDRVFLMGFSNGGMMVYRYLCAAADTIEAAASFAGPRMIDCAPNRPISMLHLHGTADETVPYQGGAGLIAALLGVSFSPVPQMAEAFAADDGCATAPVERTEGIVTTRTWTGCGGSAEVQLVTLAGWSHSWPLTPEVNGTDRVLDFFGI